MDDFSRYMAVLDVDGNAWSDRFARLIYFNTPILKQTSPWKEFFAHLIEGHNLTIPFKNDLSDLITVVHRTLQQYTYAIFTPLSVGSLGLFREAEGMERFRRQVDDRRTFATEFLSQFAILRATAYTLTIYSRKQTWNVTIDSRDRCVTPGMYNSDRQRHRQRYPPEFVHDVFRHIQSC